jgi:dihydroxy-acid dehydratase
MDRTGHEERRRPRQRSAEYFSEQGLWGFIHRSFAKGLGFDDLDLGRPVIGICNTFSEANKCHSHFRELVEAVKRGVWQAGGLPLEFPTISLGEPFVKPTSMLYRNLMAMDTEEMLRALPLDGVVLLGGCDKSIPAQLMAAASADIPAIQVSGGPMLDGRDGPEVLGACTDCYGFVAAYTAGALSADDLRAKEELVCPSAGHCMVMGTASTMAILAEALGMMLPGTAAIPAPYAERLRACERSGRRIVAMVGEDLRPSRILTPTAFDNAIRVLMAIGGSTNAVLHLIAIAGRRGIDLTLSRFDELSRTTPWIVNVRPSGRHQMETFFHAGGTVALMRVLMPLLDGTALTCTGAPLREAYARLDGRIRLPEVITSLDRPLAAEGGIAVLRGNLCPGGAVIKTSAASPHLLHHRGRARVLEGLCDGEAVAPEDAEPDDILVLRGVGPVGGPGMPEVGQIPLPPHLLRRGVRDMVRISDARLSGTSFGTLVAHVAPEAAVGGPLALVEEGDEVELDVGARRLTLRVDERELARRGEALARRPPTRVARGYVRLYQEHVLQADRGCDFDFLLPDGGGAGDANRRT